MVGCRTYGRLGNFLWQAAATIAYALKHDQEFSLPNNTADRIWHPLYLQHLVHPNYQQGREDILLNENGMPYQELEWRDEWKDKQVVLNGYWQSWKYVDPYRDEILYLFNFPYEAKPDVCSVHARYGDYLTVMGKHIIIDEPYLRSAIDLVKEKTGIERFKVFSDDIKMFKEKLGHIYNFEYSTNINEVDDLVEISCCHSQISSSSTFSWWGAWLNKNQNKIIVTPRDWFQEAWGDLDTKDVIPPYFIKL